jgi:putative ABC transport system permease protein
MKSFMFLSQFIRDMRSQKLRTFLTVFGIIWGTISVVLLLGFGVGVGRQMRENMHGLGEGIIILWPARTSMAYQGLGKGRPLRFREEDAFLVKHEIPQIKAISPEYSRYGVKLIHEKNTYSAQIQGIYPEYEDMRNVIPERGGRFINDIDIKLRRRVIFIGYKIKEELFKEEPAIGKHVFVNSVPFQVIGILVKKTQNSTYGNPDDSLGFIPATTFSSFFGYKYLSNMVMQAHDPSQNELIKKRLVQVLGKKYKFNPEDTEALGFWDTIEDERITNAVMIGFNIFLGIVGAFTLIVGAIGVSNIMNVVVEERTREIGLKMALGAKKGFILAQFLFETLLITLVGGAIGLAVSYGIIAIFPSKGSINEFIGKPTLSLEVALITVALLGLIGFVSGFGPSRRAANLNPVEAIRS